MADWRILSPEDPLHYVPSAQYTIETCLTSFGQPQPISSPGQSTQSTGCAIFHERLDVSGMGAFGPFGTFIYPLLRRSIYRVPREINATILWPNLNHNTFQFTMDRFKKKVVATRTFRWNPALYPENIYENSLLADKSGMRQVAATGGVLSAFEFTPFVKVDSLESSISADQIGHIKIHLSEFNAEEYFSNPKMASLAEQIRLGQVPTELRNLATIELKPDPITHAALVSWALRFANFEAYRILLPKTPDSTFGDPLQGDLLIMSYSQPDSRFLKTTLDDIQTQKRARNKHWGVLPYWAAQEKTWDRFKLLAPLMAELPEPFSRKSLLFSALDLRRFDEARQYLDGGLFTWKSEGPLDCNAYEEVVNISRDPKPRSSEERVALTTLQSKMEKDGARERFSRFLSYMSTFVVTFEYAGGSLREFKIIEVWLGPITTTGKVTPEQLAGLRSKEPFFRDFYNRTYYQRKGSSSPELDAADATGQATIGGLIFKREHGEWFLDLTRHGD